MNTRLLMSLAALVNAALGLACTFAPQELLVATGASATGVTPLFVQLLGAALVGWAMTDWMARESLLGGIYGRPIAIGNLVHFTVAALALVKAAFAMHAAAVTVAAAVYALLALAFTRVVFFGSPVAKSDSSR